LSICKQKWPLPPEIRRKGHLKATRIAN